MKKFAIVATYGRVGYNPHFALRINEYIRHRLHVLQIHKPSGVKIHAPHITPFLHPQAVLPVSIDMVSSMIIRNLRHLVCHTWILLELLSIIQVDATVRCHHHAPILQLKNVKHRIATQTIIRIQAFKARQYMLLLPSPHMRKRDNRQQDEEQYSVHRCKYTTKIWS